MALFTLPHFPYFSISPKSLPSFLPRSCLPSASALFQTTPRRGLKSSAAGKSGVAVLWFKHDLRIDDHPGLVAASEFSSLVPLYVFDHRILSRFSDEMLELVLFAVADLRKSLRDRGSDLMIRFGPAESIIQGLVNEVNATNIFAEAEVEYEVCKIIDAANKTLEKVPSSEVSPDLLLWQAPFYEIKSLEEIPSSYDDFMKLNFPITSALPLPKLPGIKMKLDWGSLPSSDNLKDFMNKNKRKSRETWDLMRDISSETILQNKFVKQGGSNENSLNLTRTQTKRQDKSIFMLRKGESLGGGTHAVLNALAAYLRYTEGKEIHEMVRSAESRDGASFVKLFGPALCLGVISRRRLHYEAIKYEKERNAGFLSPFRYSSFTVTAAIDAVCSMEWYWLMGLKGQLRNQGMYYNRIWRWNGFLIQYTVVGGEGPPILLVHGFGAFLEHYRDNINGIAKEGNQVWSITLLGFGGSEKPNIVYTELMWADLLKDFTIEVVTKPVHLVGNSIGGYVAAIVANLWPALIKSVILINSAGSVIPGYSFAPYPKERQASGASWLGARLLLFYLRLKIRDIVKNCYPTRSERVDDWLISEMIRASHDPGVAVVLESIFSFNLSIPLNYLLEEFKGKVLIIQGMKDPLSDSRSMLAMFKEHFSGVVIKELDAGHCPHDEQPEEVNCIINEWIVNVESELKVGSL